MSNHFWNHLTSNYGDDIFKNKQTILKAEDFVTRKEGQLFSKHMSYIFQPKHWDSGQ